jgi:hypothetical protein
MSLVRSFVTQSPTTIARELIVLVVILGLATLATIVSSGPSAGVPFDTRLDQVPLPF